ncbi:MAG: AAA family ATPase [Desulfotomaculales bacterium]
MVDRPFPVGGPAPEEDIVDREEFLESLEMRLAEGQSVVVAGPRRTGKTTLALEVLRRLKRRGFYTAAVDLFRISDRKGFATALVDACLENRTGVRRTLEALKDRARAAFGAARLMVKIEDLEVALSLSRGEPDEEAMLDAALDLPETLAERDGRPMVVLFDEFQDAARAAGRDIYRKMRACFQHHRRVAYLFLGSRQGMMRNLFGSRKEPFYRFAVFLPVPPIPEEAWVAYIVRKFAEQGIEADDEAAREILRRTEGHPYNTMLVCAEIRYALLEAGKTVLTPGFVRLGFDRALVRLSQIYDEMLDDLGGRPNVRQVLLRLAAGGGPYTHQANPAGIKRALDFLISRAVIEKSGRGSYRFVEPMFREYVLRHLS